MKIFKWAYGALALVASVCLVVSFFTDVNQITQITLLIQSVGFGWICGFAIGGDL